MTLSGAARQPLSRRSALLLPFVLVACQSEPPPPPPQVFAPLDYSYLPKLRLNVANVDVNDAWTPNVANAHHVEYLSPAQPADALRRMAQERLVPGGSSGRATFVIDDASLIQIPGSYSINLAVHLDVATADGTRSGWAEARVNRTRMLPEDPTPENERAALYGLVKQAMDDMNVEFEYQVRRSLKDYLQSTEPVAPPPPPVSTAPLPPPPPSP